MCTNKYNFKLIDMFIFFFILCSKEFKGEKNVEKVKDSRVRFILVVWIKGGFFGIERVCRLRGGE